MSNERINWPHTSMICHNSFLFNWERSAMAWVTNSEGRVTQWGNSDLSWQHCLRWQALGVRFLHRGPLHCSVCAEKWGWRSYGQRPCHRSWKKLIINSSFINPQEPQTMSISSTSSQSGTNWHVTQWVALPSIPLRKSRTYDCHTCN